MDHAVHVLLLAGMSSPALRSIAALGVDIEFAAYSEIGSAITVLGPLQVLSVIHFVVHLSRGAVWRVLEGFGDILGIFGPPLDVLGDFWSVNRLLKPVTTYKS